MQRVRWIENHFHRHWLGVFTFAASHLFLHHWLQLQRKADWRSALLQAIKYEKVLLIDTVPVGLAWKLSQDLCVAK